MWIKTSENEWLNLNQVEWIYIRSLFRKDNNEKVYRVEVLTTSMCSKQQEISKIAGIPLGQYDTVEEAQAAISEITGEFIYAKVSEDQ